MIDLRMSRRRAAATAFAALAMLASGPGRAQISPPRIGPAAPVAPKAPAVTLPGPQTINAATLVLGGRDSGPRVVDAQTIVLGGRDSGPRTLVAGTLVLSGQRKK